jgi:hypothetical protein
MIGERSLVDIAYQLWVQYYYLTEEYDRSVCSGISPLSGDAIPKDHYQRSLSMKRARTLYDIADYLRKGYGITHEEWTRAKIAALRNSHVRNMEIYNTLDYKDIESHIEEWQEREATRARSRRNNPVRFRT